MAKKNNIRSMRFSDDMIEMIESQQGNNFSEKFENLVTRCMWELPEKEKKIKKLDKDIESKYRELEELGKKWRNLQSSLKIASQYSDDIVKYLFAARKNL